MVPRATFTSYYGRPVVKPAPWGADIPAYLFLGGLAGGSSLLGAGADLTGRPALRRTARVGAATAAGLSLAALIHDLGRPGRFLNMLRVAKPTSPMSVGTWILTAYAPLATAAAAAEVSSVLPPGLRWAGRPNRALARPAGLGAAVLGSGVATYTAVLLAGTATPSWHGARRQLPLLFAGSSAAAAGGLGLLGAPVWEAEPARRLATAGALVELGLERRMESALGLAAEPLRRGGAGRLMRAARLLTAAGGTGALLAAGRSRGAARLSGLSLLAGSACLRFGVFSAGRESALDPRYTVIPQRERLAEPTLPTDVITSR